MKVEIEKNKTIQSEADDFFSNRNYLKARTLYNKIITNDPFNDYCHFQLLIINLINDDFNESLYLIEENLKTIQKILINFILLLTL